MTDRLNLTHEQFDRLRGDEQAALQNLHVKLTSPRWAERTGRAAWQLRYDQLLAMAKGAPIVMDPNRPGHRVPVVLPAPRGLDEATSDGIQFDILTDSRYRTVRGEFRTATRHLEDVTAEYRNAASQFSTVLARGQATGADSAKLLAARHAITLAVQAVDEALTVVLDVTGAMRVDACEKATRG